MSYLPPVFCRRAHVLFMLFVFLWVHYILCSVFVLFVFVLSLFCLSSSCLCFVCLRLVFVASFFGFYIFDSPFGIL